MGYLGASGPSETARLGDGSIAEVSVRANSPELRTVLAAAAMGAMLEGGPAGLPHAERADLARQSGLALLAAAGPFAESRGRLGRAEQAVEMASVRLQSERTSLAIQRNDMLAADPFTTATRLQEVQTQLQITFEITARLAGLSFADYLR
jgi:flagellar hook-associated protein 3 FlgL